MSPGEPSGCLPLPLVTMFAQHMMQRAQSGFIGQYIGHVSGPNGIIVSVSFTVMEAIDQLLSDSASNMYRY